MIGPDSFMHLPAVPTTAGASVLNPFHPFGLAKRLRRMPCSLVHEDHFLRIHEAEMAGLVKVTIKDEVRTLCRPGFARTEAISRARKLL